jgi:thiol-disulfide isomerase/thioredoxin
MIRYSLKDMKFLASEQGGKCLSKEYHGMHHTMIWMCSRGHTWDMLPSIVKQGGWCQQCLVQGRRKLRLQELKEIAISRDGKCLSKEYIDNKHHLEWECKFGHRWQATPGHVKNVGSWCPHCAKKAKLTIEQMQDFAQKKGGKCISKKYVNSHAKLVWECEQGHKWKAAPSKIQIGRWCPHYDCRYKKVSEKLRGNINELKAIAKMRGGKLISTEYINRYIPLEWECESKHRWFAKAANVKFGLTWCPVCLPQKKQKSEYKLLLRKLLSK